MKLILAVSLILAGSTAAGSTLKGVVLANELGGPGVSGVQVSAHGANVTETDASGQFTLEFPKLNPGDPVHLTVSKPGYVVVNDFQLAGHLPKDADIDPLKLVICKQAERDLWASRLFRAPVSQAIDKTYKRRLQEAGKDKRNEATIAIVKQERDQARTESERLTRELVKLRSGDTSEVYAEAMEAFLKGDADGALRSLDDKRLQQLSAVAKKKKESADAALDQVAQAYLLKAQLFATQFQFKEAREAYQRAIDLTPSSIDAHVFLGLFSRDVGDFDTASREYMTALAIGRRDRDNPGIADAQTNLGNLEFQLATLGEAKSPQDVLADARLRLDESVRIYKNLAEGDPGYLPFHGRALADLANIDSAQNRNSEARTHYEDSIRILHGLALQFPGVELEVAGVLTNLAYTDARDEKLEKAREEYDKALGIFKEFEQTSPETDLSSKETTLRDSALLYLYVGRYPDARRQFEEALKISREWSARYPASFKPLEASNLLSLIDVDVAESNRDSTCTRLEQALDVMRGLPEVDVERLRVDLAKTEAGLEKRWGKISAACPSVPYLDIKPGASVHRP